MAGEGDDSEGLAGATHEPRECMACRGTGRVISNLGGSQSSVECPWCAGSGLRRVEVDAQARWSDSRRAGGAQLQAGVQDSDEQSAP